MLELSLLFRPLVRRSGQLMVLVAIVCLPAVLPAQVLQFEDDFNRPDGTVDGWVDAANSGIWSLSGGALTITTPDEAHGGYDFSIWAGSPPISFGRNIDISFDYSFLDPGHGRPGVGRHGGISFLAPGTSTGRGGPYTLDWIDRVDDHGFRWNASALFVGGADPPLHWRI